MSICYVNGKFVAKDDAKVSIFDRGYLFSDGIYEVSMVLNSKLVDNLGHLERLKLSLAKLDMKMPMPIDEIIKIQNQLIEKNNIKKLAQFICKLLVELMMSVIFHTVKI